MEATLERLERIGFLDDVAFARWWVEQRDRHAPRGRMALEAELRAKRIPPEILEALRADVGELTMTEEERATGALERHLHGRPVPTDPKALQRLGMFLVRRGFGPGAAKRVLQAAIAESTRAESTARWGGSADDQG